MQSNMQTQGSSMNYQQQWDEICSQQGWGDQEKVIHLLGAIEDMGMSKYLITYAQHVVKEESAQTKLDALEEAGYTITEDSGQDGMYLWMAPTDAAEISYSTRAEAIEAAWADAVEQVLSIADMSQEFFTSLTLAQQCEVVRENLAFA